MKRNHQLRDTVRAYMSSGFQPLSRRRPLLFSALVSLAFMAVDAWILAMLGFSNSR